MEQHDDAGVRQPSLRAQWTWALRDSDLPRTPRLVAYAMGAHMNTDGECFPSYERLLRSTGLHSRSTLSEAISELAWRGWINVVSGGGRRVRSRYTARIPSGARTVSAYGPGSGENSPARDHKPSAARTRSSHEVNREDDIEDQVLGDRAEILAGQPPSVEDTLRELLEYNKTNPKARR